MARIALGQDFADDALLAIAKASTVEQLRQAQAVILPLLFAMSLEQTAQITGLSVSWVSKQRNRFIQGQPVVGGIPVRGGRRRQNLTPQQEDALLAPFLEQAKEGGVLVVSQLKPHIDAALARSVSLSSVYALLHRHNWRKLRSRQASPKK